MSFHLMLIWAMIFYKSIKFKLFRDHFVKLSIVSYVEFFHLARFQFAPLVESLAHAQIAAAAVAAGAAGAARVLPSGSLDLNCRMTQQKQ